MLKAIRKGDEIFRFLGGTVRKGFKVQLAAACLPPAYCLSSVVLENLVYGFAVGCFMLGGIAIVLRTSLGTSNIRILAIASLMELLVLRLLKG